MSIIVKRADSGEAVFTEGRRGNSVAGILVAVLLLPGTFVFFLSPGKGGLAIGIVMAVLSVAGLSAAFGSMVREALRNRDRIKVTSGAITFRRWSDGQETTFRHEDGGLLLVFPRYVDYARWTDVLLTQLGTGRVIGLSRFPRGAIKRACKRRGWRFGYDPAAGERHLRLWRDWGSRDWDWLQYAASLVGARGPVNVAAEPGGHVSLGAAILGQYAAGLRPDRGRKARACQLAADAQRSFAALATSPEENAARLAEADKLQAVAQSLKVAKSLLGLRPRVGRVARRLIPTSTAPNLYGYCVFRGEHPPSR